MIKWMFLTFVLCGSIFADKTDDWNKLRLEYHRISIEKMSKDVKLQSLDRRVRSLYIKLGELFKRNTELKKLIDSLQGKLGKERSVIVAKINALQDKLLKSDALLAEEQKEIIDKINKLNEEIYNELMKDPRLKELEAKLKAVGK
jgi:chromosome segregation ATPase